MRGDYGAVRRYQVNPGDLREQLEIIDMTGEPDDMGGQTIKETNPAVVFTAPGRIEPLQANEVNRLSTIDMVVTHRIIIRYHEDKPVRPEYHVREVYGRRRIFAIRSIIEVQNRRRTLVLIVDEAKEKQ